VGGAWTGGAVILGGGLEHPRTNMPASTKTAIKPNIIFARRLRIVAFYFLLNGASLLISRCSTKASERFTSCQSFDRVMRITERLPPLRDPNPRMELRP